MDFELNKMMRGLNIVSISIIFREWNDIFHVLDLLNFKTTKSVVSRDIRDFDHMIFG